MILDKCKNCKYYKPDERKVKSIFSSKVKTKYLRKGDCTAVKLKIGGFYKSTNNNGWCERYERKAKEKNDKHHVYNYTCPVCHEILSDLEDCNYCPNCGTILDWSKNK